MIEKGFMAVTTQNGYPQLVRYLQDITEDSVFPLIENVHYEYIKDFDKMFETGITRSELNKDGDSRFVYYNPEYYTTDDNGNVIEKS